MVKQKIFVLFRLKFKYIDAYVYTHTYSQMGQ